MRISDWSSDVCSSDLIWPRSASWRNISNNAAASVLAGRQVQAVCQDCGGTTARRHGNEQPVEFRHIEPGARAACGLHAHAVSVGRDPLDISDIGSASCMERVCQYV